jgi:hypothetical protein
MARNNHEQTDKKKKADASAHLQRKPLDDPIKRLDKLESKGTRVVVAFTTDSGDPLVVPKDLLTHPKDKLAWQVVTPADSTLEYVEIEFKANEDYFPSSNPKNKNKITAKSKWIGKGKVPDAKHAVVDKYTVRWKFEGKDAQLIDPTIIVTDP